MLRRLMVIFAVLILIATSISADVPNTINYQGRLTDASGDAVIDGGYLVKFIIYDDAAAGTDLWNSGFQSVTTVNGLFSYQLGSIVALPNGIFADTNRYLGVTVGVDPELTPRSRFITTSYAYKSQNADLALDSDSLGGSEPSFYLDWNNMTNIPADIADGDDGISSATADGDYVNVTGDNMTGTLNNENGAGTVTAEMNGVDGGFRSFGSDGLIRTRLYSFSWGQLYLYDADGDVTVDLGANSSSGGFLNLIDPIGAEVISLNAGSSGNGTVNFPDNAIDNTEILDEPGIVRNDQPSSWIQLTSSTVMQDIVTVTITTPASGYIYLTARGMGYCTGSTAGTGIQCQIDETAGGGESASSQFAGPVTALSASFTIDMSLFTDRVYFKPAGTYTFRFEAKRGLAAATNYINAGFLTAMYFPTSYGAVVTSSPQPPAGADAELVTSTNLDGSTASTDYRYDLRDLELKAKASALKAKQDELELLKAQQQQNRQEQ